MPPWSSSTQRNRGQPPEEADRDWMRLDSSDSGPRRPVSDASAVPMPPGYELLGELGRDEAGIVYKARDLSADRIVAVKLLATAPLAGAELIALRHPNLVPVLEVGEWAGRPFRVMEYVEGPTLAYWLAHTPPTPLQAAQMIEPLARGLAHAHAAGVVHRGLSPQAILVQATSPTTPDARLFEPRIINLALGERVRPLDAVSPYRAPEQLRRFDDVGPPADIYALGAILYEMLTGRPPLEGANTPETLWLIQYHEPIPPRRWRPSVPRDLETICLKCLEKSPARRYRCAAALADDLARFRTGQRIQARPIGFCRRALRLARREPTTARIGIGLALGLLMLALVCGTLAPRWGSIAQSARHELLASESARSATEEQLRLHQQRLADRYSAEATLPHLAHAIRLAEECQDPMRSWANRVRFRNTLTEQMHPLAAVAALPPASATPRTWSLHPTGQWAIVTTSDRVHLWHLDNNRELSLPADVAAAVWNRTGDQLALATADRIEVRRFPDDTPLVRFPFEKGRALAFSATGQLAAAGTTLNLWDIATQTPRGPIVPLPVPALALTFAPAGDRLACAGQDDRIRVFDPRTLQLTFEGIGRSTRLGEVGSPLIQPPMFIQGGTRLAAWHPTRPQVLLYDCADGRELARIPTMPTEGETMTCLACADDQRLLVGGSRGVAVVNLSATSTDPTWFANQGEVWTIAAGPSGQPLLAAGLDPHARWLAPCGEPIPGGVPVFEPVVGAAMSADGSRAVLVQESGLIVVWQRPAGIPPRTTATTGPGQPVLSPDGRWFLVAGSSDSTAVCVRDAATGQIASRDLPVQGIIRSAAFARSEPLVYLAVSRFTTEGEAHVLERWNRRTGERLGPSLTLASAPIQMLLNRDDRLAVLAGDGRLTLVSPRRWSIVQACELATEKATRGAMAFSPDGQTLLVWGADSHLHVLDAERGEVRARLDGGGSPFTAATCSPDGRFVVAAHDHRGIGTWDTLSGEPAGAFASRATFDRIVGLRFSSDGSWLLSIGRGGTLRRWDWPHGELMAEALDPSATWVDVMATDDDRWFAAIGDDGTVRLRDTLSLQPLAPAIDAGGRAAFAGSRVVQVNDHGEATGYDLSDWLQPETADPHELIRRAALLFGHDLRDGSNLVPLSQEAWLKHWRP